MLIISIYCFTNLFDWKLNLKNRTSSKKYLSLGLFISLSILFVFKYFDFFVADLAKINLDGTVFERIILPIGISFYTFQSISYIVDVYYKKSEPTSLKIYLFSFAFSLS